MSKQGVANKGGRGARQRILDTAAELFYRDGINATGVERLAAESSVSKRTLYQHFPSKTAVVEEYLRGIEQRANRLSTDTSDLTPRQRLLAVFDTPKAPTPTLRGCPLNQQFLLREAYYSADSSGASPSGASVLSPGPSELSSGAGPSSGAGRVMPSWRSMPVSR